MRTEQHRWTPLHGWEMRLGERSMKPPQLVLVFGAREPLADPRLLRHVREMYPGATLMGCSTAGEIADTCVYDDSLVVTAIHLEHSSLSSTSIDLSAAGDSFEAGRLLASRLPGAGLVHSFVLSDGQGVNGSRLTEGLLSALPEGVTVTGGVAADGERFAQTLTLLDSEPAPGRIVLLGLYGERLRVGYGSRGGWDPFGPERLITRARENVLYEVDGKPALQLYKKYLGEHAENLPADALLFPLSLRFQSGRSGVVRTILQISEEEQSMTFAGDIPEGAYARLMKANFERLLDGATAAAKTSYEALGSQAPDLAILISCVGRKMVLKQRIEEELEGVRDVLGPSACIAGFYSYGEISPFQPGSRCELHNQTMTITTLREC